MLALPYIIRNTKIPEISSDNYGQLLLHKGSWAMNGESTGSLTSALGTTGWPYTVVVAVVMIIINSNGDSNRNNELELFLINIQNQTPMGPRPKQKTK